MKFQRKILMMIMDTNDMAAYKAVSLEQELKNKWNTNQKAM